MSAPDQAAVRSFPAGRFTNSVWRDLAALAFLALLTVVFFWPVFFARYWLPHGGGDLVSFLWPQYSFAGEAIRSGSIPLWNPYLYSGAPFLADNQTGALYPINLLAFLIFPSLTYQVMEGLVIFHIWLAGAAMYVALRYAFEPTAAAAGIFAIILVVVSMVTTSRLVNLKHIFGG